MQSTNNKFQIVRYPLATAGKRIVAKFLDLIIVAIIVTSLGFAIFCTDPNFKWNSQLQIASWRYGLFVIVMFIIFELLLFVLPLCWKKTIGMRIFKLFYHKKDDRNFAICLFKHELFVWEIIVFIALIMGILMSFLKQEQIDSLIQGTNSVFLNPPSDSVNKVYYYLGTAFSCLYTVSFLFLLAIIVGICIKNSKPAFHDKYSLIYVVSKIKLVPVAQPKKIKLPEEISGPGVISSKKLEEIDNI